MYAARLRSPRDRGGDVARAEAVVAALAGIGDLAGREVLGHDLPVVTLANHRVVHVVAARDEHPLDEIRELGKRVDGVVPELRLQGLQLALPFVAVETRLQHRRRDARPAAP